MALLPRFWSSRRRTSVAGTTYKWASSPAGSDVNVSIKVYGQVDRADCYEG